MLTTYRTGSWHLLISAGVVVALPPNAPEVLVSRLWERQGEQRSLAAIVDILTDHSGGSLAAMPFFAAAVLEGNDVRTAVRGPVTVTVTGSQGVEEVSGQNVTTWSERFVGGATALSVRTGDLDGVELPIVSGVVLASEVQVEFEAADSAEVVSGALPSLVEHVGEGEGSLDSVVAPEAASVEDRTEEDPSAAEVHVDETPVEEAPVEEASAPAEAGEPSVDSPAQGMTLIPEITYSPTDDEIDELFGETVHSAPPLPDAQPPVAASLLGDHDGATISAAQARALRTGPGADADAPTEVLSVMPTAQQQGRIVLSTGQTIALDRTVIIGRRPRATRASGATLPHLVAVESPQQDISRSHLEVRPEGDTVVIIDLHTTNGSTLLRPGADPVRLHPGEQTLVLSGDRVDLGDGVIVTFEDLP